MSNGGIHYLFQKCANWHRPSHVEIGQFWHCASLGFDGHGHEANRFSLAAWSDGRIVITFCVCTGICQGALPSRTFSTTIWAYFSSFLGSLDMWTSAHQTLHFKFVIHDQHWSWTSFMKEHLHLSVRTQAPSDPVPSSPPPPPFFSCTCYRWMETRLNLQILCNARCKLYLNVEFFLFLTLFKPALWRPRTYGIQCLAWCRISTNVF